MSGERQAPKRGGRTSADGPDDLRSAVERTLAATAGSASEAGQRARDLLDEVVRRGEAARDEVARRGEAAREGVARRGEAAREEVVRRGEAAREEVDRRRSEARDRLARGRGEAVEELTRRGEAVSARLADVIGELRGSERPDVGPISDGLAAIERRLEEVEAALRRQKRGGDRGESPRKGENVLRDPESNPQAEGELDPAQARRQAGSEPPTGE